MAIARNATITHPAGVNATSLTFAHTVDNTTNSILIVGNGAPTPSDVVTGVTFNGAALTIINKAANGEPRWEYLWYKVAPASGSNNVVITASTSSSLEGMAWSYTGVHQTTPIDSNNNPTSAASNAFSPSTTVVGTNCWLVCSIRKNDGIGITAGAQTFVVSQSDASDGQNAIDSGGTVGTGSQALNVTANSAHTPIWVGIIASILPAPAASTASGSTLQMMGV